MSFEGELVVAAKPAVETPTRRAKRRLGRRKVRRAQGELFDKKLSRLRKPDDMSLEDWQIALRRQFGREQNFRLKNVGQEAIFSEFEVTNPQNKRTYRVAIRGERLGENFCSCPDFAVNTLGTCKHIEFTLARLGRTRKERQALALGFVPRYSEVYLCYGAKREVVFRPGTECPEAVRREARRYFDAEGRLKPEAYARFHLFLRNVQSSGHEVRCYDDTLAFIAQVRDAGARRQKLDEILPRGAQSGRFKSLLKVNLYPYQRAGALFAAKAGRCLIADEMGLGKTIQAIAAAELLARTTGLERVLVVSPTSLKHQWQQEIERFTDRKAIVVEGLSPRRAEAYAAESFYKLTNYEVVHRDLGLIRRWRPDLIILDEAQRIKNWKTRTAQSVKQLESEYAFVLTGTPLENRLEELHSIVEFVDRYRLGPMFRFLHDHQHVDETGRVIGYRSLSQISRTLAPILVRRTKQEVLPELPERLEKRMFVPMTEQQMQYHEENREIVARIVAKWRRYGFLSEADQRRLMIAMQNMRMSCNSTYLLDKKTDYGVKADEVIELLGEILEQDRVKVVLFSQWVRMHELIMSRLKRAKWEHVLFSGKVPGPQRKGLIRRFRDDPACRLFLSTDAGGVGLNLQHAEVVINLDLPWNPAVLEQRIGRVHRLGQHRPVRVVHFISQGTIEEGMLSLLGFKTAMFAGVLDRGEDEVFLGGTRLKRFMESVEKATTAIPAGPPAELAPSRPEGDGAAASRRLPREAAEELTPEAAPEGDWSEVLTAGASLLNNLFRLLGPGGLGGAQPGRITIPSRLLAEDETSGQPYLKLPLPEPETLGRITELIAAVAKSFSRR
jgi:superfamily II DNA or RNA helicase